MWVLAHSEQSKTKPIFVALRGVDQQPFGSKVNISFLYRQKHYNRFLFYCAALSNQDTHMGAHICTCTYTHIHSCARTYMHIMTRADARIGMLQASHTEH